MNAYEVKADDELHRLHDAGRGHGFIFNEYSGHVPSGANWNVLHASGCIHVRNSNTSRPKYFFNDHAQAVKWIASKHGDWWKRCKDCLDIG